MTTASVRPVSRLLRFFASACVPFALVALSACGTHLTPTLAQVSGRTVEVVEAGVGNATVVFESGWGDGWTPWDRVATEVATGARVFAYSRPGYGDSDPGPEPRDPARIVEDLRTLLVARGFAPPYVLVGHSFGGAYMELFAKAHREEVAGVVLVDPRHRGFTGACEKARLQGCTVPASTVASLPQVEIAEFQGFARASEQIHAAGAFGPYPVRVLTATSHGFAPEVEALWKSMLGELADEAMDGDQIVYPGAGHYLQIERAHEVAQVVMSLVPARGE